jgi:hypothetical protein
MRKLLGTVALVGVLAWPGVAQAQTIVGGTLAWNTDAEDVGIGAYVALPLPALDENIVIKPDFTLFFPDVGSRWELNGDLAYRFDLANNQQIVPFAMAGLNIVHVSVSDIDFSDTDVGLNLGGGVIFPLESIRPAVGGKFEIHDNTSFVLFGSVGFPLG